MADAPLTNGIIGVHDEHPPKLNGTLSAPDDAADSPAIDSPATPVDNSLSPDVKIDVQSIDQEESDVRHEPIPMKLDRVDQDASVVPQVATPADPDTIPIDPPKGTPPPPEGELLEDVKMAEAPAPTPAADVDMSEAGAPTQNHVAASPPVNPAGSPRPLVPSSTHESLAASSPYSNVSPNDDDVQPPPAKRARKHSDADQASLANTATPPPASLSPAPIPEASPAPTGTVEDRGPSTFSVAQYRFCLSTIRTLKKLKTAAPFLKPVDVIALNIPHYHSVIKQPMDFSTIERKLQSSNPAKPDPNLSNPRYFHADEFVADVRLIFTNCVTFNGDSHVVTAMGRQVEEVFDKQMKNLPPAEVIKPPVVKKVATPPPPPPPAKKPRRMSNVPVIRRTDEPSGRPKREIHPPPPKDLPYTDPPKKLRKSNARKDNGNAEQLKFCEKMLKELNRKQHYNIAQPFYDPVDWEKLQIPSYPKIIKHPMDLSTMRKKLESGQYPTADKFYHDFKLMIRNCFTFNPTGTPVNLAGQELSRLFEEKWKNLPPLHSPSDDEEDDEEEASDDDRTSTFHHLRWRSMVCSQRRELDSERMTRETQEQRKTREESVAKRIAVQSEISSVLKPFYCELCDKQFKNVAQYDEHTNSYAHHHKARFRDMQAAQRVNVSNDLEQRKEKERKREEKELRKLAKAAGIKMAKLPTPALTPASEPPTPLEPSGQLDDKPSGLKRRGWATVGPSSSFASAQLALSSSSPASSAQQIRGGWASGSQQQPPPPPPSTHSGPAPAFRTGGWTSLDTGSTIGQTPAPAPAATPAPPPVEAPPPAAAALGSARGGWATVSAPPQPPALSGSASRGGWQSITNPVPSAPSPAAPSPSSYPNNESSPVIQPASEARQPPAAKRVEAARSGWQQFKAGSSRRR